MGGNMGITDDAIRTGRLLLRPLRAADAEPLFALFSDWEVIRWLATPPWPYTAEDARTFVDLQLHKPPGKTGYLAITRADALIGGIELGNALGYWLGRPHWGAGYMTEAARAYIGHLFAATAVDPIYSAVFVGNDASLRVQEKLGFERIGMEMVLCRPRGEKLPQVRTRLTRAQFLARLT
jgi:RimJ/RimL family protein N-acetyltransferase